MANYKCIQSLAQQATFRNLTEEHIWASQVALTIKNPPAKAGGIRDMGLIPSQGRSPGEGNGNPLQYSCLENPMDKGAWGAIVHRVTKSQTWLKRLSIHACIFTYMKNDACSTLLFVTANNWNSCKCPTKGDQLNNLIKPHNVILCSHEKWITDFPAGPVAKTPYSQCRVPGFNPWSRNLTLHTDTKRSHVPPLRPSTAK